jgi:cyclic lactone autoinducer peptide
MNAMKKALLSIIAKHTYSSTERNVNSACMLLFYQPKTPQCLEKLKRK